MGNGNGITEERAKEFGIQQQRENETHSAFRYRVSERLRQMGYIIEAHEAQTDHLYDDPNGNAMIGITGAVAKSIQRKHYPGSEVATDIAAGVVVSEPENPLRDALLLLFAGIGF